MREPKGPDLTGRNHPRHPFACNTINLQRIQQGIIQVKAERRRESGLPLMPRPSNGYNAPTIPRPQDLTDTPSPFDWNLLFVHAVRMVSNDTEHCQGRHSFFPRTVCSFRVNTWGVIATAVSDKLSDSSRGRGKTPKEGERL